MVEAIKPLAKATRRSGVIGGLGGFGGLFDPRAAGFADPVLVAATDGVGTKLKIATAAGRHDTVGIDLVAMCVNDIVVQGAEPLFLLDYIATGALDTGVAKTVIAGIVEGCRLAGCALTGGETAEMPGLYAPGDYDLAGFCVGAAERGRLLPRDDIAAGDVVLGMASSGLHSNGFSLVRRIVEAQGVDYGAPSPVAADETLAETLLTPTRIYVASVLQGARSGLVKGFSHITGGGLIENIPRVLPDGLGVRLDAAAWPLPGVFRWLAGGDRLTPGDLAGTFNCGIGMVAIVAPQAAAEVRDMLATAGETVWQVGEVVPAAPDRVAIGNIDAWDG